MLAQTLFFFLTHGMSKKEKGKDKERKEEESGGHKPPAEASMAEEELG